MEGQTNEIMLLEIVFKHYIKQKISTRFFYILILSSNYKRVCKNIF